jgi:hypothetical protein
VLDQPANAADAAVAAAVLAASVISAPTPTQLQVLHARLTQGGLNMAQAELRNVLTCGDVSTVRGHRNLILKNFTSTGLNRQAYVRSAVAAYDQAKVLLSRASWRFIWRDDFLLFPRTRRCFRRYFGDASENVTVAQIPVSGKLTGFKPRVSRRALVRYVLHEIHRHAFSRDQVRLYFGGKHSKILPIFAPNNPIPIDLDVNIGYNRTHPDVGEATRIHLSSVFFDLPPLLRAGNIVHELSHAWIGTKDWASGDQQCSSLASSGSLQALANADSYQWFVIEAFG